MRVVVLALLAASTPANALDLVCDGQGARTAIRAPAMATAQFSDQVEVSVSGNTGRIRVPTSLLPQEHSGGSGGWWDLYDVAQTSSEIRGRFRFNFMNKPEVRINRLTGHISIDAGRGQFSGTCAVFDPATMKPKF